MADLANLVAEACDESFAKASNDPAFHAAIHLLCKIPLASKQDNLVDSLSKIGICVPNNPCRTDIIVGFERALDNSRRAMKGTTDLSELAKKAGIAALNIMLQKPAPSPQQDFFREPKSAMHRLLENSASSEGFAELAQNFFANFAKMNIRYFIDRELPKHLGVSPLVPTIPDMAQFDQSLERHCQEASPIMRTFARDWYGKVVYNHKKELNEKDVKGFSRYAAEKMRKEFNIRNNNND